MAKNDKSYNEILRKALDDYDAKEKTVDTPPMQGWICPVCGRGLSPFTSVCPCKNGKDWEITC